MILVTGATGNVGSELVKQLAAAGQKVRALVRDPHKTRLPTGVEAVAGDLNDPNSLAAPLAGVGALYLLTPSSPSLGEIESAVVEVAKKAGVKRVVKQSVMGAEIEPAVSFGRWHQASEKHLRSSGLSWTFLRPTSFMSNFFLSAGSLKAQSSIYGSAGDGKDCFIDPVDIAAAAAAALTQPGHQGQAYELTGPEALSYSEVAQRFSSSLGKKISYVDVPGEALKKAMAEARLPAWLADALVEFYGAVKAGYTSRVSPAVEKLTGRKPRSVDAWLKDHAAAFRG